MAKKISKWALALAAASIAASVQAQSGNGLSESHKLAFQKMDANADGKVDANEFLAKDRAAFSAVSTDGKSVDVAGCVKARMSGRPAAADAGNPNPAAPDRVQKLWEASCRRKADASGRVTWERYAGGDWRRFKALDASKSGVLTEQSHNADAAISVAKAAPKAVASPEQMERIKADLAAAKTRHAAPRSREQVKAQVEARQAQAGQSAPAAPAATVAAAPAPAKAQAAPVQTQPVWQPGMAVQQIQQPQQAPAQEQGIAERISNWLR